MAGWLDWNTQLRPRHCSPLPLAADCDVDNADDGVDDVVAAAAVVAAVAVVSSEVLAVNFDYIVQTHDHAFQNLSPLLAQDSAVAYNIVPSVVWTAAFHLCDNYVVLFLALASRRLLEWHTRPVHHPAVVLEVEYSQPSQLWNPA